MKKIIILLSLILSFSSLKAQENYTVKGETIQLKTEIEGKLDLLWNIIDKKYRYFIRTIDGTIVELLNTKNKSGNFAEEYKTTLKNATTDHPISTEDVKLTLYSLSDFVDKYNALTDPSYSSKLVKRSVQLRLGGFGGITNSPFVTNDDNIKTPLVGVELEVIEGTGSSRHSGFLQLRHVFDNKDFEYSTTELSLGYRFRIINASKFRFFANVRFATVNFSNSTIEIVYEGITTTKKLSDTAFDVPFIFGVGAEFRISDHSFLTLGYDQLFAAFLDNQGNFSTDISLGYKVNL